MPKNATRPPAGKRVTAAMVAERAGTSVATVSLVANGKHEGRVSQPNVERVREAIAELNYVADHAAQALATGTSNIVLLVTPDASNPFFGSVISGIRAELGTAYQLLVSVTGEGNVPTAAGLSQLAALRPAGLLVDAPSEAFLREMQLRSALVLLDAPGREGPTPAVNFDLEAGVRELVEHLHERGHRHLGYLAGRTETETFILRDQWVTREAGRLGMTVHEDDAAASLIDLDAAAAAFRRAWPSWRAAGVTAIVCATDTHAYGVLRAAAELGLRVPDDIAVTGFDNLPYSTISDPPLTSVDLSGEALGRAGARTLIAEIEGRDVGAPAVLEARLVKRASTVGERD
ncbi:LacI family DNA-binding transcriptional regulator [Plantibacter sp. YIM 135347]|uniref:LacI family DNA-binding transcriptional regulator n=1 Tax=Plantibacter sp. YIM 135347 TaxID=3423919 RepID=UPI003D348584